MLRRKNPIRDLRAVAHSPLNSKQDVMQPRLWDHYIIIFMEAITAASCS
jgi:hypothetical protein